MKGSSAFPYPKMREALQSRPGWYYSRGYLQVFHSSEMLADKRLRSRRAIWGTDYYGRLTLHRGHDEDYYWWLGPDRAGETLEEQRSFYFSRVRFLFTP